MTSGASGFKINSVDFEIEYYTYTFENELIFGDKYIIIN